MFTGGENFRNFPVGCWSARPHLFSKNVGESSRVSVDIEKGWLV
jgi:hypothetical protein